jgi:glycosyltransferase involved in cell wall biosynthesis
VLSKSLREEKETYKMPKSDQHTIAYIMKEFPRLSETFIMNEVRILEGMGLNITVFSVKQPPSSAKQHETLRQMKSGITYLPPVTSLSGSSLLGWLWLNFPKFLGCHYRLFRQRPEVYLEAALEAVKMTFRYRPSFFQKPKKVFIKEFIQAGYIADKIISATGFRHLHGHFCHGSTTITLFVSQLTGLPFSFTAHAKDIYLSKLNPGDLLNRKIDHAKFVVTCTGVNKAHLQSLSSEKEHIHTIYHGLDTSVFQAVQKKRPLSERPLILAVGRFVEKKGFHFLMEACRILVDRGYDFRCQIVGEADDQSDLIRGLIETFKLEESVQISGGVTQQTLREIYSTCAMFVLPCQIVDNGDRDGIPNVLVEAMAMEIPVISTDISGIPELIEDKVNGLLIPQKNSEGLARAIEVYLKDSDFRVRMGQEGRKKVCDSFDSMKTNLALKALFVSSL